MCFFSGINLTYNIISKANGAEGDKCKVNSFTVGPALCYLEEDWWQAQKNQDPRCQEEQKGQKFDVLLKNKPAQL